MAEVSGPQLFARYVVPCGEGRLSQQDFEKLRRMASGEELPDVSFLREHFPKPFGEMVVLYKSRIFVCELWDKWIVKTFWHQHQDAIEAMVCEIKDGVVQVIAGSKTFNAINPWYELQIDDMVYLHHLVVTEKSG